VGAARGRPRLEDRQTVVGNPLVLTGHRLRELPVDKLGFGSARRRRGFCARLPLLYVISLGRRSWLRSERGGRARLITAQTSAGGSWTRAGAVPLCRMT
jgi:hypothetical protein